MEGNVTVVTVVLAVLGILSAALGFAAEAKRVKPEDVVVTGDLFCDYPSTPASGLGLAAAGLLVVAIVIIHIFAGCLCCMNRAPAPSRSWTSIWVMYIFSWITFLIALILLIGAAALNLRRDHKSNGYYIFRYCHVVKSGVSGGGAALALSSIILGIAYYRSAELLQREAEACIAQQDQGIAMAQPHFSSQTTNSHPPNPGFIQGDAYGRPQFV